MFKNSKYEEVYTKFESWDDKELKNELGECIKSISWQNVVFCTCIPIMIAVGAQFISLTGILAGAMAQVGSSYDFFSIVEDGWYISLGIVVVLLIFGIWSGLRLMQQELKRRVIEDILNVRDEEARYSRWQAVIQGQVFHVDITMHNN